MLAKFFAVICGLVVCASPTIASAQKVDHWKYRGKITWTHPDGRVVNAVYANTRIGNDRMSLIRDISSGRIYIQFLFQDASTLLDRQSRFFILDGPIKKEAKRIYLELDGRVWPGSGASAGVIVSQVTKSDVRALVLNSGNLIGVTYSSVKDNAAEG